MWDILVEQVLKTKFLPDLGIAALPHFFGKCRTLISPMGPKGAKKGKKLLQNVRKHVVRLACFARVRLLRHALPISLLILRKKPTVLQSSKHTYTYVISSQYKPKFNWLWRL